MANLDVSSARVLTGAETLEVSRGAVAKPDSYNYRTMRPERRGLYCEDIFGEANLSIASAARTGIVRRAIRLDADDRKERWGHIELPEAIPHPLRTDALIAHVLVVPPWYRRFVQRSAEESRRLATARRAELLAMLADENHVGSCGDGTDRPDKLLVEEGLETEEDILQLGPTWEEPPLNGLYRAIVNDSLRLRRCLELRAMAKDLVDDKRLSLAARVTSLFEDLVARRAEHGDDVALRALSLTRDPQ